jgi:hypothetical protein
VAQEPGTIAAFEAVLDETCERLWDTRVRYSLRRIDELDRVLASMERELDEMARAGTSAPIP